MLAVFRLSLLVAMLLPLSPAPPVAAPRNVGSPRVTVVGPVAKVRPADHPVGASAARLVAAKNEFESFQVIVESGSAGLHGLSVALGDALMGPGGTMIPERNVTIYREAYVRVKTPSDQEGATGLWPDALIPTSDPYYYEHRRAFPVNVPANANRVAWVDVLVPKEAEAGRYQGSLWVTAVGFNETVPVQLTVLDWAIPSESSLASAFGLLWRGPCQAMSTGADDCRFHPRDGWQINALYVRAALDNRITISTPWYQPPTTPDRVELFREYTVPLVTGIPDAAHPELHPRLPGARLTTIDVTPDFGEPTAVDYIERWRDEATAQSFADRAFIYACDEPGGDADRWYHECKSRAEAAAVVWPDVAILVTASIQDVTANGAAEHIDWLVTNLVQMHNKPGTDEYAGNQRPKYDAFLTSDLRNRLWLYTSCTSHGCPDRSNRGSACTRGGSPGEATAAVDGWAGYTIDAPASQARAMGWLAFVYGTTGELYYRVDYCLSSAWGRQFAWGGNGDGTLFYAGKPRRIGGIHPIPIESMRLKLIRDGYEDYEYLYELAKRGQHAEALAVAQELFPNLYSTTRSEGQVQAARSQLACLIDVVRFPCAPGPEDVLEETNQRDAVAERRDPLAADPCVHRDGGRADSPGRLLPSQALLGPHNRVRRPMTPRGRTRRSTRDALSKSRSAVLTFLPRSPRILIGGFRRSCSPEPS